MIDRTRIGATNFISATEWVRTDPADPRGVSENGYRWPEDKSFPEHYLAYHRGCAEKCKAADASFCITWDLEGHKKPQPEYAYVGHPRYLPPILPPELVVAGNQEYIKRGVRIFCTIRHDRARVDEFGRTWRDRTVDPYWGLRDVIDFAESLQFSGAYWDSNIVPGRRLWKKTPTRGSRPPCVDPKVLIDVLDDLGLYGEFDVICEWGDERYEDKGLPIWTKSEGGDVRVPGFRVIPWANVRARDEEHLQAFKSGDVPCMSADLELPKELLELWKKAKA